MFTLYATEKNSRIHAPAGKAGKNVLKCRDLWVLERTTGVGEIQLRWFGVCPMWADQHEYSNKL
jgi:hypothetical protein